MSIAELPVLKAAAAMLEEVTGKPCGVARIPRVDDTERPGNQTKPVAPPYQVVYPIPGGRRMGPAYGDEGSVATLLMQVSCVGERGDEALWMRDRARQALLGLDDNGAPLNAITIAGLSVMRCTPDGEGTPTDDNGLVTAPLRVALHIAATDTP